MIFRIIPPMGTQGGPQGPHGTPPGIPGGTPGTPWDPPGDPRDPPGDPPADPRQRQNRPQGGEIHGYLWISMDIHGIPGYLWISMDIHGYPQLQLSAYVRNGIIKSRYPRNSCLLCFLTRNQHFASACLILFCFLARNQHFASAYLSFSLFSCTKSKLY